MKSKKLLSQNEEFMHSFVLLGTILQKIDNYNRIFRYGDSEALAKLAYQYWQRLYRLLNTEQEGDN